MTVKIVSYKYYGPGWPGDRTEKDVETLAQFIREIRSSFEDQFDAVGVVKDGVGVAIWIAEPDVDCDLDGFYEVAPAYPGQEYIRYEVDCKRFWNHFAGYFGSRYIPADVSFVSQRAERPVTEKVGNAGEQCLTAAERNPSMLSR